jgi:hypothetical protein
MAKVLSAGLELKRALLPAYLDEIGDEPLAWRKSDCVMAVAGWVERLHGIDCSLFVPPYESAEQGLAIIENRGGFDCYAIKVMAHLGFAVTPEPEDGDVGLIDTRTLSNVIGGGVLAILWRGLWIGKADKGLHGSRRQPIMSWRL